MGEEKHFDKHTTTLGHNHIQQRSFVQHTQQLVQRLSFTDAPRACHISKHRSNWTTAAYHLIKLGFLHHLYCYIKGKLNPGIHILECPLHYKISVMCALENSMNRL